jgi:hypothetical protein
VVTLGSVHGLQHLFVAGLDPLSDLLDRRRMAELRRQLRHRPLHLQDSLLDVAGDVNRPAPVAEVPLELAEDGRDGEGREGGAALRIEAIDGLDESDACHLDEIVEGLCPAGVAGGEPPGQRHEAFDELLADNRRMILRVALEQTPLVDQLLLGPRRGRLIHLVLRQGKFVHRAAPQRPWLSAPVGREV